MDRSFHCVRARVCVCVCMCECVCVCARARARERERECACVRVSVCVFFSQSYSSVPAVHLITTVYITVVRTRKCVCVREAGE